MEPDLDDASVGKRQRDLPYFFMVRLFIFVGRYDREMQIWVNGTMREFSGRLTVSGLLQEFEIQSDQAAVELNLAILERSDYAKTDLKDGDKLEIIRFVGGG